MPVLETLGTLQTVQGAVGDLVGAVRDQDGWVLLRERFSPDARIAKEIAAANEDWWRRMWAQLRDNAERLSAEEQAAAFDRITSNVEGAAILANYVADAHREPLKTRRELLEHATAGLIDLGLSIPELARIWRVLRELDASDVLTLYKLWLMPNRGTVGRDRVAVWEQSGAEALLASGAVRVAFKSGAFAASRFELEIGSTGRLVLAGLRTYLATRTPAEVPGHETTSAFASTEDARRVVEQLPGLDSLRVHQNKRFGALVQFDSLNIAQGANPKGRAQLIFRALAPEAVAGLGITKRDVAAGTPVSDVWFEHLGAGDLPGTHALHVAGPHDVLRTLAYDLFAMWS